jgi:glutathione S-transferase
LVYLATRYDDSRRWYPPEPAVAAEIQRWLSVAAGQLAYGPAAARRIAILGQDIDPSAARAIAQQLFAVMEAHLTRRRFLAADHATIADVALYSYTLCAPEGGLSLEPYPAIRAWLERVESLDGFVPMQRTVVPTR